MYSYIPNYHQSTVQTAHLNVKLKSHIAFDNAAEALAKQFKIQTKTKVIHFPQELFKEAQTTQFNKSVH